MQTLSATDTQNLNFGIRQLYAFNNFDTFGLDALSIVHQLVPSDWPLFHVTDVQTFQVQDTFLPNFPTLSLELIKAKTRSLGEHPIAQNMLQAMNGACKISDFLIPNRPINGTNITRR
jgi:hypothetical protein